MKAFMALASLIFILIAVIYIVGIPFVANLGMAAHDPTLHPDTWNQPHGPIEKSLRTGQ